MTIPSMGCGFSKEEIPLELTMAEKRDLIERITELVKNDILNKQDRNDIFRVCLAACSRELAKLKEE
jgi:hypothetical protein